MVSFPADSVSTISCWLSLLNSACVDRRWVCVAVVRGVRSTRSGALHLNLPAAAEAHAAVGVRVGEQSFADVVNLFIQLIWNVGCLEDHRWRKKKAKTTCLENRETCERQQSDENNVPERWRTSACAATGGCTCESSVFQPGENLYNTNKRAWLGVQAPAFQKHVKVEVKHLLQLFNQQPHQR